MIQQDQALLWRIKAQVMKQFELMEDAQEEIESRPEQFVSPTMKDVNLHSAVDLSCHTQNSQLFKEFLRCAEEKGEDKCMGWYSDYTKVMDTCTSKLTLKAMMTIMEDGKDKHSRFSAS